MLNECIEDAKKQKKDGICVVTSTKKKPFLTDKKFFEKKGFETCDTAPPYFELMVLKLNKNAKSPEFSENAKKGICVNKKGFTFIYSNQCPFMEEYIDIMTGVLNKKKIPFEVINLKNNKEAQKTAGPFGTLSIFYNGEIKSHEIMPEKKFEKFIEEVKK